MPNPIAMNNAIKYFYRFLATELVNFLKIGNPEKIALSDVIGTLEKEYLLPSLEEAKRAAPSLEHDSHRVEWTTLAQQYHDGMKAVLDTLVATKTENKAFHFTAKELCDIIFYQHQFNLLRPYLELIRNPEIPQSFRSSTSKSPEKSPKKEARLYYPVTDKELSPFILSFSDFDLESKEAISELNGDYLIILIEKLIKQHDKRIANTDLLHRLTQWVADHHAALVTEEIILNWVAACDRKDGKLVDYDNDNALSNWLEILLSLLPKQCQILQKDPQKFVAAFFHEMAIWHKLSTSQVYEVFEELNDADRILLFLHFLQGATATYQRRESQKRGVDFYSYNEEVVVSLQEYITDEQASNLGKLFELLNLKRPIVFF